MLHRAFRPANGARSLIKVISCSQIGCSLVAHGQSARVDAFQLQQDEGCDQTPSALLVGPHCNRL
jgi:hypothetical protein